MIMVLSERSRNMQIATWNVNSVRTRLEQITELLKEFHPDVLCLQETKVDDPFFPHKAFEDNGYEVSFYGQKAYNGVALISLHEIQDVRLGFHGELEKDDEVINLSEQKRIISGLINDIRVINLYVPNGSALNTDKYQYKLAWLKCLERYLREPEKRGEQLCVLGDFNIAPEDKDIHSPERLSGGIMASNAERHALQKALGGGLEDVFRIFEPETNHWSWWDYRSGAWDRDRGWRIDQIYLSEELLNLSKSCLIHKQVRGNNQPSDHAPVVVDINWPAEESFEGDDDFFN